MAQLAGLPSDFKIYNKEFFGGMNEVLIQNTDVFNAASRGGLALVSQKALGHFEKESYMKKITGLVTHQDITSIAAVAALKFEQGEKVRVKVHRKIGPVAETLNAWKMIDEDPRVFSFLLGQQSGKDVVADMLDTGVSALVAALSGTATLVNDITGAATPSLSHIALLDSLALFGDAANEIVCWLMHSRSWFDLAAQAIDDQIPGISNTVITSYTVPGFSRPFVVTDAPALLVDGAYYVIGLTARGLQLLMSQEQQIESQMITGLEQLVVQIQGEYAFNIGVKGYTWDVSSGGENPTNGEIATTANWDEAESQDKARAGVLIKSTAA